MVDFSFAFAYRSDLERRAGGNPSWNVGVDYSTLLSKSPDRAEVVALYAAAGINLARDLGTLNAGARIKSDPGAAAYLDRYFSIDGDLAIPVLTMHTTGDGLVMPANESAYAQVVGAAGKSDLLRQVFVHRAGHCIFSPAETISALQVLLNRIDSGRWDGASLQPADLNASAQAQGTELNQIFGFTLTPAFVNYTPPAHPRPHAKGAPIDA
jgi:hypothetical protein